MVSIPEWSRQDAITLCIAIEQISPTYGCHVALTGGLLYKTGPRKDADIVLYRIRQVEQIDFDGLFRALKDELSIEQLEDHGFCKKAIYEGREIDFLCPDVVQELDSVAYLSRESLL